MCVRHGSIKSKLLSPSIFRKVVLFCFWLSTYIYGLIFVGPFSAEMSRNWMYTFGFKSFKQLKNHVHNKVEGFLIAVVNKGNELGLC